MYIAGRLHLRITKKKKKSDITVFRTSRFGFWIRFETSNLTRSRTIVLSECRLSSNRLELLIVRCCSNTTLSKPMTTCLPARGTCNTRTVYDGSVTKVKQIRWPFGRNGMVIARPRRQRSPFFFFLYWPRKRLHDFASAAHYVWVRFIYRGCCNNVETIVSPDRLDGHWRHRIVFDRAQSSNRFRVYTLPCTLDVSVNSLGRNTIKTGPPHRYTAVSLCNTRRVWKTEPNAGTCPPLPLVFQKLNYLGQRTFYLNTHAQNPILCAIAVSIDIDILLVLSETREITR